MRTIDERCWNQNQSWNYLSIHCDDQGNRFRVDIRRNAHDDQSHTKVEIWRREGWVFVHSIPIQQCFAAKVCCTDKKAPTDVMRDVAKTLLRLAKEIID